MSSLLDGETRFYSLYGQPVSHSLSPLMFNTTFEKLGFNRAYVAFDVSPNRLGSAVDAARSLGFEGFNVTMPHKTTISPFLDKIENGAEEIGSVNTVVRTGRRLKGYNTDGDGALRALRAYGFEPQGQKVLVIGAGGAARAITHSLARKADEIRVLDRNAKKARSITDRLDGTAKALHGALSKKKFQQNLDGATLLVNATPVRTSGLVERLDLLPTVLPRNLWIFDLAYDPRPGGKIGKKRIHPLEMLVQQAALSYELWLGEKAPLELMRSILVEHNGADWK